jgi:hypothetical protein
MRVFRPNLNCVAAPVTQTLTTCAEALTATEVAPGFGGFNVLTIFAGLPPLAPVIVTVASAAPLLDVTVNEPGFAGVPCGADSWP